MAADSAVMVIDAAKGVEAQTIKLFKVCTLRHIPIFTFINKMDREARDPFELMENIEEILGIKTYPMNWPIGCGKEFKGVFDRNTRKVLAFSSDGRANGVKRSMRPRPNWVIPHWMSCSAPTCTSSWRMRSSCWTVPPRSSTWTGAARRAEPRVLRFGPDQLRCGTLPGELPAAHPPRWPAWTA